MIRRAVGLLGLVALSAGITLTMGAAPAVADCGTNTGHFCAYTASQYVGLTLHSGADLNSEVDVQNDVVSSGKNGTGNYWWGMNEHSFAPDDCVFYWAPHTAVSYVGNTANDKIDHFAVKSGRC